MRKRLLASLFVAGAAAAAFAWLPPFTDPPEAARPGVESAVAKRNAAAAAKPQVAELPPRARIGEPAGEIFAPRSWTPAAPASPAPQAAPPPMPYRFAGKLMQDGVMQVLLAKGDVIVPARQGETLEGGYRVEAISDEQITLLYLPLKLRQVIPVSSALGGEGEREVVPRRN